MKQLKSNRGTTLVEAVCGLVILTVILVGIYAGFTVVQKVFGDGDTAEQQGLSAFSAIETGNADKQSFSPPTVTLGGKSITFTGQYVKAGDSRPLYSFEAVNSVNYADSVRQTFIQWTQFALTATAEEKKQYNLPGWCSNSTMRSYIWKEIYHENWPILPTEFFETYLTDAEKNKEKSGLLAKPVYIQPYVGKYYLTSAQILEENTFVFAKTTQSDGWNINLIYDHDEHAWYYRSSSSSEMTDKDWATVKAIIHQYPWRRLN